MTTFTGVTADQIGPMYDFALGFDPGTGIVDMIGYVVEQGQEWSESTDLQEVQRLITSGSPNVVDRDFTRWPKVSQGDWTGGERQLVFPTASSNTLLTTTVGNRYFISDGGVEIINAAQLQAFDSSSVAAISIPAGTGNYPLQTDGDQWYLGLPTGHVVVGLRDGTTVEVAVTTDPVVDLLPGCDNTGATGCFVACVNDAGTSGGIWFINAQTRVVTQWEGTSHFPDNVAQPCMAYVAGKLFYVGFGGVDVGFVSAPGGVAGDTAATPPAMNGLLRSIVSTSTGMLWAMQGVDSHGTVSPGQFTLYTTDSVGATATVVSVGEGLVKYMHTMSGITYVLCLQIQKPTQYDYSLFTWNGTQITLLDDLRTAPDPEFQAKFTITPNPHAQLWGDGRFLDVAWPGLAVQRYDTGALPNLTVTSKVARNTGNQGQTVLGHRMVRTNYHNFVDFCWVSGQANPVLQWTGPPDTGQIISSYYDFGSPGISKAIRSIEFSLAAPLTTGQEVGVEYQLDSDTVWQPMQLGVSQQVSTLLALFPAQTFATRVRFRVTITSSTAGSPVVNSWATKANLGRVWKTSASCKRNQQTNNAYDAQGTLAQDLIGNLQGAYQNAGNCVLLVPAPYRRGVDQVYAVIEDYTWHAAKPGPRSTEIMAKDIEGVVDLTMTERLGLPEDSSGTAITVFEQLAEPLTAIVGDIWVSP